jgi:diacylglycerol kinase family enzyme
MRAAYLNGHLFVNNSSIGLYAHLVQTRERNERRLGKWRALVRATLRALRDRPARPRLFKGRVAREVIVTPDELRTVEVACDGEVLRLHTPLVYRTRPRALRVLVPRHGHSVRAG